MYGKIFITEEVLSEFGKDIESWIKIRTVTNRNYVRLLGTIVDLGEASAIALSLEFKESLLILDDLKARKPADSLNLKFTGLLGILPKAKQRGIISSVAVILNQLKTVKFRISSAMEAKVLELAGEA